MLTGIAFTAAFLGLLLLALVRHPIFGLYAYMTAFYVHPPSRWWAAHIPDLRWSLLAAGVTLLALLIRREAANVRPKWFTQGPAYILLLFCIWMWIQTLWALDSTVHMEATIQFSKYLVAFYLVWRVCDTPERITNFLLAHIAGCLYLGILAFEAGLESGSRLDGVGGPGIDDANTLSMFLGTGVAAAAALLLQLRGWRWWFCLLAVPFILNGMILGTSRGAFLGVIAGAGMVLAYLRPRERALLFWTFAALGAGLAISLVDQRFIERMLSVRDAVQRSAEMDHSAQSRWVLIQAQFQMAQSFPHGAGHKGTAVLSPVFLDASYLTRRTAEEQAARSSHNTFMTALVEQGVVGAFLFVWMSLWTLRVIIRLKRMQASGTSLETRAPAVACCAAVAVVWVSGQFTDYLMAEVQFWMFGLLASNLHILEGRKNLSAQERASPVLAPALRANIAKPR